MTRNNAFDRELGLKVCAKRCAECLFSSNHVVSGQARVDEIVRRCERTGRYFICHKATIRGDAVVCRAFFDRGTNELCRIAERANFVTYIDENGAPVSDQNQGAST